MRQDWNPDHIFRVKLKGDERILDLGCGDGETAARIASLVPEGSVVGMDLSPERIGRASKRYTKGKLKNVTFKIGDPRALDFESYFDIVFSDSSLHCILDHRPVLNGISQSLKPGGRAILSMAGKGTAVGLFNVFDTIIDSDKWARYFEDFHFPYGLYDGQEYEAWLAEAALTPVRVELSPTTVTWRKKQELIEWVRSSWPSYSNRIPETKRNSFIKNVVDSYLTRYPVEDGEIAIPLLSLDVEAAKR